jgi:hypothetical protein
MNRTRKEPKNSGQKSNINDQLYVLPLVRLLDGVPQT